MKTISCGLENMIKHNKYLYKKNYQKNLLKPEKSNLGIFDL